MGYIQNMRPLAHPFALKQFPDRPVHLGPTTGRHRVAHVRWVIVTSAGRFTMG
jgi:hypothetical protein